MTGWLVYRKADAQYNKGYVEMYLKEGIQLGIEIKLIFVEDISFGIKKGMCFLLHYNEPVILPDFAIVRTIYPMISRQLEYMGVKVFNSSTVSEICNDKARTYQYLSQYQIPMMDTAFFQNQDFPSILEKDMVVKAVDGHGGKQVFFSSLDNLQQIKQGMEASDLVIQPLLKNCCEDVRVYVIGKKIISAICRKAKSGFKSNFSLGGQVSVYHLNKKEIALVKKIIDVFSFGLVGIDFLIDENGALIFNEIEDVVGARMLYQCTDINLVSLYLNFILEEQ